MGQTADSFKDKFGPLPGRLQKLYISYSEASDALSAYASALQATQAKADSALRQAQDAEGDLQRATTSAKNTAADLKTAQQNHATNPNPQAVTDAQTAHDTAQATLNTAKAHMATLTAQANQSELLPELRLLLQAYNSVPSSEWLMGTPASPSKAMLSYLRMATFYPGRAFRATAEILYVFKLGLDDPRVVSELDSMSPIPARDGRTREDCLEMMIPHLVAFTEGGETAVVGAPETPWEWRERLPNLGTLLGGYYHRDVAYEHGNPDGAVDNEAVLVDCFTTHWHYEVAATVSEIGELLAMGSDEDFLKMAASELGLEVAPPGGLSHREWLSAIARDLQQRLDAVDYQPSPPPNPAYPAHDKRAWEQ